MAKKKIKRFTFEGVEFTTKRITIRRKYYTEARRDGKLVTRTRWSSRRSRNRDNLFTSLSRKVAPEKCHRVSCLIQHEYDTEYRVWIVTNSKMSADSYENQASSMVRDLKQNALGGQLDYSGKGQTSEESAENEPVDCDEIAHYPTPKARHEYYFERSASGWRQIRTLPARPTLDTWYGYIAVER